MRPLAGTASMQGQGQQAGRGPAGPSEGQQPRRQLAGRKRVPAGTERGPADRVREPADRERGPTAKERASTHRQGQHALGTKALPLVH